MTCEEIRPLLSAYLDGELAPELVARVRAHLASCRDCRGMADDYLSLGRELLVGRTQARPELRDRVLAALAGDEGHPEAARSPATVSSAGVASEHASTGVERSRFAPIGLQAAGLVRDWRQMAAALALCVLSSVTTLVAVRHYDQRADADAQLVAAHVRALVQDNPLQVASSDSHTVRPWFAGRVDFAPNAKDLAEQGYPLIGGRLDMLGGTRVAVAVYKRKLHWINVFMAPAAGPQPAGAGTARRAGYNIVTWTRDGILYRAVSDLNLPELQLFSSLL